MTNKLCRVLAVSVLAASLSAAASAQTITGVVPILNAPNGTQGIAINVLKDRIYAVAPSGANDGVTNDSLAVIDGSVDMPLSNLPNGIQVPPGAEFVAVDTVRNLVYVAGCNYFSEPLNIPCYVTLIDGRKDQVIKTVQVTNTLGYGLTGIAVNSVTGHVYVANASDNVINILEGCELELEGSISLNGNSPNAIAVNPVLNLLYVPYFDNQIATVDATRKKILATTTIGTGTLQGAAVNLRNGQVFVTDSEIGPSATGVMNLAGKFITSTTVDDGPLGVDVDPVTNLVFVAATQQDEVQVLSGSTYAVTATVVGVTGVNYLAVNPVTKKVYASGLNGVTVMTE